MAPPKDPHHISAIELTEVYNWAEVESQFRDQRDLVAEVVLWQRETIRLLKEELEAFRGKPKKGKSNAT